MKCGEHADRRIEPGEHIGEGDTGLDRLGAGRAVGLAGDRHDAAHALDHEIVARTLRIGAGLAEAGDRAINELRIDGFQAFIVEAVFLEASDLEVLHHDIGFGGQIAQQLLAFGLRHVDGDRLLAAIGGEVIGRIAARSIRIGDEGRAPASRIVTFAGLFDLDHLGPEIGEDLGGPGAGQHPGKVEDADILERPSHFNSTPN
jgi:hypothetical protein